MRSLLPVILENNTEGQELGFVGIFREQSIKG